METIDIIPIQWREWSQASWTEGDTRKWCHCHHNEFSSHRLEELGEKTNTYRYSVYCSRSTLLNRTIKLDCCGGLRKCPIGNQKIPISPCREAGRIEAIKAAYTIWVEYLTRLAAAAQTTEGV